MKRLFVDGQIFQTNALFRGMGVLALQLLEAVQRQQPDLRVTIIINTSIPITEQHRQALDAAISPFEVIETLITTPHLHGTYEQAVKQLEATIAEHTKTGEEAQYVTPALFLFDYFALFPANATNILIFHDLIPLVEWDLMKRVFPGHVYFERLALINKADIIAANSQNTALELRRLLGTPAEKIHFVGGSPRPINIDPATRDSVLRKLGLLGKEFVLMPTGGHAMWHKNNQRAAEAFGMLRRDMSRDIALVTTSRYSPDEQAELQALSGDAVIFTGNVSIDDMDALFTGARSVIVPSTAEGLGIPVLEALSAGVPVACSNIPVFDELTEGKTVFYGFDPYDVTDIRDKLFESLAAVDFKSRQAHYQAVSERFSPAACAARFIAALEAGPVPRTTPQLRRLNVLTPSPLSDTATGYIAQSLAATAEASGFEPVYYIDPGDTKVDEAIAGADYLRYLAESHDILRYVDHKPAQREPHLVFVSPSANFTKLAIIAQSLKGYVLYLSDVSSEHLLNAMRDRHFLSAEQYERQRANHTTIEKQGLYAYPALLSGAKAIIVEARLAAIVKRTVKALGHDVPIRVVDDNQRTSLAGYVHGESAAQPILDFVSEVYRA